MAKSSANDQIDDLLQRRKWKRARDLIESQLEADSNNHWLLTQLGVTFYEERKYVKALKHFKESLKMVDDCPLTLWNIAGTLDALGNPAGAARVYTQLLRSQTSSEDDPCWESKQWTASLKADCMYRLGITLEKLGRKQRAEKCYRQYLDLLLGGVEGLYSAEDVTQRIRRLRGNGSNGAAESQLKRAVNAALLASGL